VISGPIILTHIPYDGLLLVVESDRPIPTDEQRVAVRLVAEILLPWLVYRSVLSPENAVPDLPLHLDGDGRRVVGCVECPTGGRTIALAYRLLIGCSALDVFPDDERQLVSTSLEIIPCFSDLFLEGEPTLSRGS